MSGFELQHFTVDAQRRLGVLLVFEHECAQARTELDAQRGVLTCECAAAIEHRGQLFVTPRGERQTIQRGPNLRTVGLQLSQRSVATSRGVGVVQLLLLQHGQLFQQLPAAAGFGLVLQTMRQEAPHVSRALLRSIDGVQRGQRAVVGRTQFEHALRIAGRERGVRQAQVGDQSDATPEQQCLAAVGGLRAHAVRFNHLFEALSGLGTRLERVARCVVRGRQLVTAQRVLERHRRIAHALLRERAQER